MKQTKGKLEAKISAAITKFEIDYMGRGPEETKSYIINDMIFIRLKGVLTIAEKQLAVNNEGIVLIKQTRHRLLENARDLLHKIIQDITGTKVISLHTDISTASGERIIVFTLNKDLEELLSR